MQSRKMAFPIATAEELTPLLPHSNLLGPGETWRRQGFLIPATARFCFSVLFVSSSWLVPELSTAFRYRDGLRKHYFRCRGFGGQPSHVELFQDSTERRYRFQALHLRRSRGYRQIVPIRGLGTKDTGSWWLPAHSITIRPHLTAVENHSALLFAEGLGDEKA